MEAAHEQALGSPIELASPAGESNQYSKKVVRSPLMAVHATVASTIANAERSLEASKSIVPRVSPRGSDSATTATTPPVDSSVPSDKGSPTSKLSHGSDDVMHDIPIHDDAETVDAVGDEQKRVGCLAGFKARRLKAGKGEGKDEPEILPLPYRKLYKYMDRYDVLLQLLGIIGALGNGVIFPIFTIIFGDILDDIAINYYITQDPTALSNAVATTVPKFMYLGVGGCVAAFLQVFCLGYSGVRQGNRLREDFFRRVLLQDIAYFDTQGTSGAVLEALTEDCQNVQKSIGEKFSMSLFFVSTFVSGIVIAFTKAWDITLVLLAFMPVLVITGFFSSRAVRRINQATSKAASEASTLAQEALANVRTVYSYNGEARTITAYDEALAAPEAVGTRQGFFNGLTIGMTTFVTYCGYALSMWYGSTQIAYPNGYTGGDVINVLLSALIGGFALGQAVPNFQGFQEGRVAAAKVHAVMDRTPEIEGDGRGVVPDQVTGVIKFDRVSFAYPSRLDKVVFDDFSLTVEAGQTVALVGESGSGKSTAVSLIERFYDPQSGGVYLDGENVKDLDLRWLRSQIGLVSQEPTLFATSIRENILFGKPDATQDEIVEAAKSANAHKFISALPDGYDTHVGEKGVQMSGGQKQRIAIARAILKNPRVLLLDEATSALDAESERVVQDALDRLMVGRTTVVVAHRLSTIRNADVIAVVKQGAIVEQGNHESLTRKQGAYATLVQMQGDDGGSGGRRVSVDESAPIFASRASVDAADAADAAAAANALNTEGTGAAGDDASTRIFQFKDLADEAMVAVKDTANIAPLRAPVGGFRTFIARRRSLKAAKSLAKSKKKKGTTKDQLSEEEAKVKVGFKRLAQLNKPELPAIISGVFGAAVMGLLFPIFALALASLIGGFYGFGGSEDGVMTQEEKDYITSNTQKWSLVYMGMGFAALFGAIIQSYSFNYMGQRLAQRVRVLMMAALLRQEVGFFDKESNSSGALTSRLSSDAMAVRGQFGDTMGLLVQNLTTLAAGLIIAGINSWRMMLVVLSCIPILAIATTIQTKVMVAQSGEEDQLFAGANQTASEAVTSIRTVVAFGMQDSVSDLYDRKLRVPTKKSTKQANIGGLGLGFSQFTLFSIYALAFWYMGLEISRGNSTFEQALKAFFAVFLAAFGLGQAQIYFPDVAKGGAATKRVFYLVDRKTAIERDVGIKKTIEGKIELRNVDFAYPERPDSLVFNDFSLSVEAGKTMALVGESGSGKSSVVSLIERFYDVLGGQVLIDGEDVRDLDLQYLRSQIGLVSQEPVLFNMSVADNIAYGCPDASMEKIQEAARAANAHSFIESLPEGYHTMLGEGCIQLSGGQKQRVAIARAIVKDPKILLLDEATSALDAESERVVQDALDRLMVGRTTVVVAHRLSTIRDADCIAVVYKGKLIEQGTHQQLLAQNGSYTRLVGGQQRR